MTGHLYGYACVSTAGWCLDAQLDALCAAGCAWVFTDRASGCGPAPGAGRAAGVLLPGDVLVVRPSWIGSGAMRCT
ncbi:MAG TPA: hypothetical protein VE196_09950 [Pseudonocardiaceae bacterium]|nr:hypothetical protein [Pseudonocardiaceae bacterium]